MTRHLFQFLALIGVVMATVHAHDGGYESFGTALVAGICAAVFVKATDHGRSP